MVRKNWGGEGVDTGVGDETNHLRHPATHRMSFRLHILGVDCEIPQHCYHPCFLHFHFPVSIHF